ncbi:hypothetical protein AB4Z17_11645 [Paenibacillus sp. TAF43_2]|uniref:hypothetical protein n=1 Tax=Paenibacillus sp. TAF43_2 TaxID=3233069 RepID=UPI003F9A89FF
MKLIKLEKQEQFDAMKKGDIVIVRWRPGSLEYKKGNEISHYSMVEINRSNEIILQKRGNVYFIIHLYLEDNSQAAEAYLVSHAG